MYNRGMSGNEQATETVPPPLATIAGKLNVQCTHCGHVQELDPGIQDLPELRQRRG